MFKNVEVFFNVSSSWVKIRMPAKNLLLRLPGSGLKCNGTWRGVGGGGDGGGFLLLIIIPP